eukprot:PhM_4_TR11318/c0_g1_i1/m.99409
MSDKTGSFCLMNYLIRELCEEEKRHHVTNVPLYLHTLISRFHGGMKLDKRGLRDFVTECDAPESALLLHTLQRSCPQDVDWDPQDQEWMDIALLAAQRAAALEVANLKSELIESLPQTSHLELILALAASHRYVHNTVMAQPGVTVILVIRSPADTLALRFRGEHPSALDLIRTACDQLSWLSLKRKWIVVDATDDGMGTHLARRSDPDGKTVHVLRRDPNDPATADLLSARTAHTDGGATTHTADTSEPPLDDRDKNSLAADDYSDDDYAIEAVQYMQETASEDWGTHLAFVDPDCRVSFGQIGVMMSTADDDVGHVVGCDGLTLMPMSRVGRFLKNVDGDEDSNPLTTHRRTSRKTSVFIPLAAVPAIQ